MEAERKVMDSTKHTLNELPSVPWNDSSWPMTGQPSNPNDMTLFQIGD